MAQASSVQREPSMEEILASIRRIIEDNDTGRKPAEAEEPPHVEEVEQRAGAAVIEVDAFRAELRGRTEAALSNLGIGRNAPEAPSRIEETGGDSEPAAHLPQDPASQDPASQDQASTPAIEQRTQPDIATWEQAEEIGEAETANAPANDARALQMVPSQGPETGVDPEIDDSAFAEYVEQSQDEETPGGDEFADGAAADWDAPKSSILSQQTERQVAAAFGELSEAFTANRRRSFDEMAEDMMRPMLQDWLDNNLPTLVEKLVREEIERVARGRQ